MRIVAVVVAFAIISVCGGEKVKNESQNDFEIKQSTKTEENINTVKTKRGVIPYQPLRYSLPGYGHGYARFPGINRDPIIPPFVITPGNSITHSFNVNYPKIYIPGPVIRSAIPPSVLIKLPASSVYANRFQVFQPAVVQKPIVHFVTSNYVHHNNPAVNPITLPSVLPQTTLISQDGWRPIFSAAPSNTHINHPSVTILPPLNTPQPQTVLSGTTHTPNNYYLPPKSVHHLTHDAALGLIHNILLIYSQSLNKYWFNNIFVDHQQHDLHAHLQHLHQIQDIQHHQNFLRSEQNEGIVTPLSEQGYETASNNGIYAGPSSYEVQLNSRGRVN